MEIVVETEAGSTLERDEMLVNDAQKVFDRTVRILQWSCDNLEAVGDVSAADVLKDVRAMNSALQHTLDMREKAREAGSKRFGTGGAGELDLGAARSEIGLRLACLRDAGPGAGVSGEPG